MSDQSGDQAVPLRGLAKVRERLHHDPWGIVMDVLGSDGGFDNRPWWTVRRRFRTYGGSHPPGDRYNACWNDGEGEIVANYGDDGGRFWLGYPDQWAISMSEHTARGVALHVLRRELLVWFGLRRWLWYKALAMHIDDTLPGRVQRHDGR